MKFNLIDIEDWNRKPYFEHYLNAVRCTYSMTANLEITSLLREIKLKGLKLYPTLIYIITTVVNRHKEFRTSFDQNGKLGYWDSMNPSYTIFHKDNETFSSIWTEYDENFPRFYYNYLEDIRNYSDVMNFMPKAGQPANTINVSSIPWVNFTAIAVQAIFTFVGSWNNYFVPALVIQSKNKMTVPILIATLRGADYMNFDMGKIYMMITVAIVPIIIVYLLLSKYIIAGITLGGVKE